MTLEITQVPDSFSSFMDTAYELREQRAAESKQITSIEGLRDEYYSRMGYWDCFINIFPSVVGSYLSFRPGVLQNYNELTEHFYTHKARLAQIEGSVQKLVTDIAEQVLSIERVESDITVQLEQMKGALIPLKSACDEAIYALSDARTQEEWASYHSDPIWHGATNGRGETGKQTFHGSTQHYFSRRANFEASNKVHSLNNQIIQFNHQVEKIVGDLPIFPIDPILGAGERILDAELNEDSPWNRLAGNWGEYWSSQNTLSVLMRVDEEVKRIQTKVDSSLSLVENKLREIIREKTRECLPNLPEEFIL